jgi:hypothetical protein
MPSIQSLLNQYPTNWKEAEVFFTDKPYRWKEAQFLAEKVRELRDFEDKLVSEYLSFKESLTLV